ncbi:MAG TPA: DNA-3-methyladenine glycosylase I, partial [Acidimicrobiales bacterium]|nr:DNA-3-methyladenine glycosylase I [Acidimicrobiales bacterium]
MAETTRDDLIQSDGSPEGAAAVPAGGLVLGDDGKLRCAWGSGDPLYVDYHDHEWGRPLRDERALFELMCLEAFQS